MNQQLELARVDSHIHSLVLNYCRAHVGRHFYMKDLARFVYESTKGMTAPDSAGRILRDLRQRGVVRYDVVNRSKSLYRVVEVLS